MEDTDHGTHRDSYEARLSLTAIRVEESWLFGNAFDISSWTANIEGSHPRLTSDIPEPNALLLMAVGLAMLATLEVESKSRQRPPHRMRKPEQQ